jgi:CRISPR system Cascade subunit CasA
MNTLITPLVRVTDANGLVDTLTFPGVFARLVRDEIAGFSALRAHQRHAWHSFLVLLAANALHRAELSEPPDNEHAWLDLLRRLIPGHPDDAPWCLVSPPDRPALLQPAIASGALAELKNEITTPDRLDMLVTSRNHDLKSAVMADAQLDDWLFALLTLQTMQGYSGRDPPINFYFGISRMNGGFANRAALSIAPAGGPGAHFRRDLRRVLALRGKLGATGYAPEGGVALLWLVPWDGTVSLRRDLLDEWYIEICRRVRLTVCNGTLIARAGSSKVLRIVQIEGGVTGDPWSPVVVEKDGGTKSLTVDGRGFGYRRMVDLMFQGNGVLPSPLQMPDPTDAPDGLQLVARALVRGQGKTEGYHERRVSLSRRIRRGPIERATDPAADAAHDRVKLAGEMQVHALKPALLSLFQNGPGKIDFRDKDSNRKAEVFLKRFDGVVDLTFFEDLWRETDHDQFDARGQERNEWVRSLLRHAENLLYEAEHAAARASRRRFRASVRANDKLRAAARFNEWLSPHLEEAK